jgi:hypothetical protein
MIWIKSVFPIFVITMLLISPLAVIQSYAEENYDAVWQLVYIKATLCHPTDTQKATMYSDLTTTYLGLYELENVGLEPTCITEDEYKNFKTTEPVNLLILIYDEQLGNKLLQSNDLDGVYVYVGNDRLKNHTVVVCDCSKGMASFESALTPWILSHELSHFVLSYKGFNKLAIQETIHSMENEYDSCIAEFNVNADCGGIKLTIRAENVARNFVVMNPYENAVGNNLIKFVPSEIDSSTLDLHRELVNLWLLGSINDDAYMTTVEHLVDPPVEDYANESYIDFQIPNGFVIFEEVKNQDIKWDERLYSTNPEKNLETLFEHISFNIVDQNTNTDTEEFPNWFKTRALLWSEKRISDKVFFDGIEHLVRLGTIKLS